jgi:aspartate kinase
MYKVMKFGGSSITKEGFQRIINEIKKSDKVIIILSAYYNVTNHIISFIETKDDKYIHIIYDLYKSFIIELDLCMDIIDGKINDYNDIVYKIIQTDNNLLKAELLSMGEYLSTIVFYEYIKKLNKSIYLADTSNFIKTNSLSNIYIQSYINDVHFYCSDNIFKILNYDIIICQGFVASTIDNFKCTLTRGGSDNSATIIGSHINSSCIEIWTDVNGIYDVNPLIYSDYNLIKRLSYEEALMVASLGGKVIHEKCIEDCKIKNIPIMIRNTYGYDNVYSMISNIYSNNKYVLINKNRYFIKEVDINRINHILNLKGIIIELIQYSYNTLYMLINVLNKDNIHNIISIYGSSVYKVNVINTINHYNIEREGYIYKMMIDGYISYIYNDNIDINNEYIEICKKLKKI